MQICKIFSASLLIFTWIQLQIPSRDNSPENNIFHYNVDQIVFVMYEKYIFNKRIQDKYYSTYNNHYYTLMININYSIIAAALINNVFNIQ